MPIIAPVIVMDRGSLRDTRHPSWMAVGRSRITGIWWMRWWLLCVELGRTEESDNGNRGTWRSFLGW